THTSAAPLKLVGPASVEGPGGASPHSHECGSVEARSPRRTPVVARKSLRTHTSAAPLKQVTADGVEVVLGDSPHSHECGSVEASTPSAGRCPTASLRTHTSAAPLKLPYSVVVFTSTIHSLRTHTSAAPLKLRSGIEGR